MQSILTGMQAVRLSGLGASEDPMPLWSKNSANPSELSPLQPFETLGFYGFVVHAVFIQKP